MKLTDHILDEAYTVYEEWGPKRAIDRVERIKQEFPSLSDQDIETILQEMKKVNATVWKIAEMGGEAKLPRNMVTKLVQEKHPYLTGKGLIHALTLINYYAWHEGYDR